MVLTSSNSNAFLFHVPSKQQQQQQQQQQQRQRIGRRTYFWGYANANTIAVDRYSFLHMADGQDGNSGRSSDFNNDDECGDGDLDTPSVILEDLNWRVEKLRLEEANTQRLLKARPRFLPYEECRKWVAAWNRWSSEEDWRSWIDMGEKRNSYIPARPDEYYGRLGQWISWAHFLGLNEEQDENGSS